MEEVNVRVDLRDDREVDVVEEVEGVQRDVDSEGAIFVLALELPAVSASKISTIHRDRAPKGTHGWTVPSLSFVRRTTGFRIPGTAAEAITASSEGQKRPGA